MPLSKSNPLEELCWPWSTALEKFRGTGQTKKKKKKKKANGVV